MLDRRFRSFLLKHQHPSEQLVLLFVSSLSPLRCPVVESLSTELSAVHSVETSSRLFVSANSETRLSLFFQSMDEIIPCSQYRSHPTIPTRCSFILMEMSLSLSSPSISLDRQFSPRREEEEESEGNSLMNSHSSVDQCRCVGVTSLSHPADHVRRPVLHVDSLSNPIDQFLHSHQPILFHFDAFISGENSSLVRSALDLLEFLRRRTSCLRNDLVFPSVLLARLFSSSAVSLRTIVDR